MDKNDKFFYTTVLLFGLFGAVAVTESVRDVEEGIIPVALAFVALSWTAALSTIFLILWSLLEADIPDVNKGLIAMAYLMALFAAVTVQKNERDRSLAKRSQLPPPPR